MSNEKKFDLKKYEKDGMLDLSWNQIGSEGCKALAEALKGNRTLTYLSLWCNEIGSEGCKALAEALKGNTTLTELDLRDNEIGSEGCKALAEALKGNTTLTELNLSGNEIGAEGCKALAEALKGNTTLTELDLSGNQIGSEGCKALAEALKGNGTLTKLYFLDNNIGSEGCKALVESLKGNRTLTYLNLGYNKIDSEGCKALVEALKGNRALTELYLKWNQIDFEGCKALAEALKGNRTLTGLYLRLNKIHSEGCKALAEALKVNTTLTELDLVNNGIDFEGCKALAEALKVNITLTELDLRDNNIDFKTNGEIKEYLTRNRKLAKQKSEEEAKQKSIPSREVKQEPHISAPVIKNKSLARDSNQKSTDEQLKKFAKTVDLNFLIKISQMGDKEKESLLNFKTSSLRFISESEKELSELVNSRKALNERGEELKRICQDPKKKEYYLNILKGLTNAHMAGKIADSGLLDVKSSNSGKLGKAGKAFEILGASLSTPGVLLTVIGKILGHVDEKKHVGIISRLANLAATSEEMNVLAKNVAYSLVCADRDDFKKDLELMLEPALKGKMKLDFNNERTQEILINKVIKLVKQKYYTEIKQPIILGASNYAKAEQERQEHAKQLIKQEKLLAELVKSRDQQAMEMAKLKRENKALKDRLPPDPAPGDGISAGDMLRIQLARTEGEAFNIARNAFSMELEPVTRVANANSIQVAENRDRIDDLENEVSSSNRRLRKQEQACCVII